MQSLTALGFVPLFQGDAAEAQTIFQESLTHTRAVGDKWSISFGLMGLGRIAFQNGEHTAARSLFEQALSLRREVGDKYILAHSLQALGLVARTQRDFPVARQYFAEALILFREVGNEQGVALCLAGFAGIAAAQAQPKPAAYLYGATEALIERIGATLVFADRADYERHVALVRLQLDTESFETAWMKGRAMTLEKAVAYALTESE